MLKVLGVVIPIDPVINNIGASQQRQDSTLGEDYCQLVSPMNNSDLISFSYFDPDEHPSLASPIYRNLPPIVASEYPKTLHPNKSSINSTIFSCNVHSTVPHITHYANRALIAWAPKNGDANIPCLLGTAAYT